jgi:cytochrome P450
MGVRSWTHWALGYAPPRAAVKVLRRNDPLGKLLTIETHPVDDIYPLIEQIRQRGRMSPVWRVRGWVTADAQIIREVLRDSRFRTFKPRDRSAFRSVRWILRKTNPGVPNPIEPPSVMVAEPPEHTRLRHPVSRAFTPRALEGLRARVHAVTDELLADLAGKSSCDLVSDYCSVIPLAVITEMLGMPPDEMSYLQHVGAATSRMIGTVAASWTDFRTGTVVLADFDRYLAGHVERLRKGSAGDSVLSDVVHSGDLSDTEIRMMAGFLLGAGFITTTHVMSKGVVALLRHPDQLAILRANPELWPGAVEEILRYDTAGQLVPRIPSENLEIHGCSLRANEPLFLLVGGANRDPAVFERPDAFDVTRPNAREHLSFSSGVHVCLGAALARMELHVGLQSLFERFPRLALAGEPVSNNSIGLNGLKHLPVSLNAA